MPTVVASATPIDMESGSANPQESHWARRLWFCFVLICCIFAGIYLARMDLSVSFGTLSGAAPGVLFIGASLILFSSLLRSARLAVLVQRNPFRVYPTQLVGSFFGSVTPGNFGEFTKIAFLKRRHQVTTPQATSALIVERTAEAAILLLVAIPILRAGLLGPTAPPTAVLAALALGLILAIMLFRAKPCGATRLVAAVKFRARSAVRACLESCPARMAISVSGALSLSVWFLETCVLWLCLHAIGAQADFFTLAHALAAAVLLGTLSGLPAGAGVFDFSLGGMLVLTAGVGEPQAISAIVLYRILSTTFPAAFAVCLIPIVACRRGGVSVEPPRANVEGLQVNSHPSN